VFGAGKDIDAKGWQSVLRQITAVGLVLVDSAGHGALMLGEGARDVFKHERQVMLRKDRPAKAREVRKSLANAVELPAGAAKIFEALREERIKVARQQGVPPYVIFHDATLRAMALQRPRSAEQLLGLPGVGRAKLDRYGKTFLAIIAAEGG
jgi:ATP-dependent DNA helicase RecQ